MPDFLKALDNVGSMTEYGIKNDPNQAYIAGVTMGSYLSELGFNLDFAPDVDVQGIKVDSVFYRRTFSDDPVIVASMADAVAKGLKSKGIVTVYKHFRDTDLLPVILIRDMPSRIRL